MSAITDKTKSHLHHYLLLRLNILPQSPVGRRIRIQSVRQCIITFYTRFHQWQQVIRFWDTKHFQADFPTSGLPESRVGQPKKKKNKTKTISKFNLKGSPRKTTAGFVHASTSSKCNVHISHRLVRVRPSTSADNLIIKLIITDNGFKTLKPNPARRKTTSVTRLLLTRPTSDNRPFFLHRRRTDVFHVQAEA